MITLSAERVLCGNSIRIGTEDADVRVRLTREYDGADVYDEIFGGGMMWISCPQEWFTDVGDTRIDRIGILVTTEKDGAVRDRARFEIQMLPLILTHFDDEILVGDGESVMLSIEALYGDLSYRWQKSENNGNAWIDVGAGVRASSYGFTASADRSGYLYRCVVENGVGQSVSDEVLVTSLKRPYITTQPKKEYAALGGTGAFRIVAGGSDISYRWQEKMPEDDEWVDCSGIGATRPELSVSATEENDGKQYHCIIRNRLEEITSEWNTLTVVLPPSILFHPEDKTVPEDGLAGFVAIIGGTNPILQWQYRKNKNAAWENIGSEGQLENVLRFTAIAAMDGYQFRCAAFNIAGTVYTNPATLHILEQFSLADDKDAGNGTVLPEGDYVFSLNADMPGVVYSLGLGVAGDINWICENRSEDCAFHTDGKLPLRLSIHVDMENMLWDVICRPMLTAGTGAEEWLSPVEAEHGLAKDFNFGWFSLGNRYECRENAVSASLPCDVTLRYRPIWKDTI